MDADVIMSAGFAGNLIIYSPQQNEVLQNVDISQDPIRYIRYDDVGGKLYLGTHGVGIPVFDLLEPETGEVPVYAYTLGTQDTSKRFFHKDPVRCLLLDPQTRYMFTCDHAGKILVWHLGTASKEECRPPLGMLDGHVGNKLRAMCWLHDTRALFSAGEDGKIIVHNVGQQKTCGTWQAHQNELMGIDEIRLGSGSHIMSWAKDGRVCVWRLQYKNVE